MADKKVVSVRVDSDVWQQLRLRSVAIGKPTAEIVERLVVGYLKKNAKKGG
jgi:hypothetical protein